MGENRDVPQNVRDDLPGPAIPAILVKELGTPTLRANTEHANAAKFTEKVSCSVTSAEKQHWSTSSGTTRMNLRTGWP